MPAQTTATPAQGVPTPGWGVCTHATNHLLAQQPYALDYSLLPAEAIIIIILNTQNHDDRA